MNRRECAKRLALLTGGAFLGFYGGAETRALENDAKQPLRLRVVSYNIQIGRGPGGSYSDPSQARLDRTAKRVAELAPDVAGLQEVDNKTNRSGAEVDQLAELARLTNLTPTFVGKTELPGGVYGIGILSKEKPLRTDKVVMAGSAHPRVLQMCEFERYVFFNTHFPLKGDLREKAAKIAEDESKKRSKPIVFVGDFNAEPNSPEIRFLEQTWTRVSPNAPTYPADAPNVQIDYVFVKNASKITVHDARVVDDPSTSDHRPVFCDITIE